MSSDACDRPSRPRGRPPAAAEPLVPVTSWLPVSVVDRMMRHASEQHLSVSGYLRLVVLELHTREFPTDK